MSRSEERELFLKYIGDTYLKNSNLSFSHKIIYSELLRFNVDNVERVVIDKDSLLSVQVGLNNKFRNNNKVVTFTSRDGYFWAIENRMKKNDCEFLDEMYNSIKLYISVDPDNIYKVSEKLFNFMIKEGIVMQSKISKTMRNDALVCRVANEEAATKVCDYLNNLNYESKVRPNPFLLDNGMVSVAMDGKLSYNYTLARLLEQYFIQKKNTNKLDDIGCEDFNNFIKSQMDLLDSVDKEYYMNLYNIIDDSKYEDFLMICVMISKNLDNTLSYDEIIKYNKVRNEKNKDIKKIFVKDDEDRLLYVINSLANYYSVSDVHNIIMKFIETGNYKLFTRRDDIRNIVMDNFTPIYLKNVISSLGYDSFVSACRVTYDKYGEEQLFSAIKKFFSGEGLNGFTNDYNVRSRLGLVIPYGLLMEKLIGKLEESGSSISNISVAMLVMDEINNISFKKNNSRK